MSKGLHKELPEAHIIKVHTVEFYVDIFQYWKVVGKDYGSQKVPRNLFNSSSRVF